MHQTRGPGALLVALVAAALLGGTVWVAVATVTAPARPGARSQEAGGARDVPATAGPFAVWARNPDGSPVRWDPCTPIRWVLNPDGAPESALEDLDEATARVAAATGLRFAYAGSSGERPAPNRPAYQPGRYGDAWAPVLVAWADPGESGDLLRAHDQGVAIPVALEGPDGRASYVTGQVVLNRRAGLRAGFASRHGSWGAIMLHELAHLVGLDHVGDPRELMYPEPHPGPVAWGPGDRAGLAHVGARGGCLPLPPPRHVTVRLPGAGRAR